MTIQEPQLRLYSAVIKVPGIYHQKSYRAGYDAARKELKERLKGVLKDKFGYPVNNGVASINALWRELVGEQETQ